MIGGLGLVTVLRLVQVGRSAVDDERRRPAGELIERLEGKEEAGA
jgi:hypothetical protein